jgi:hypothetical protein
LDDTHDVQRPVDSTVAGVGWAMPLLFAGGCVQRCGAVPGRESVPGAEPVDVADVGQQPRGAGGADAVQVEQCGAAGDHPLAKIFLRDLHLPADRLKLADQLHDQTTAGLPHDVPRLDRRHERTGLRRGQELLCATGKKRQQQPVETVDGLGPGAAELTRTCADSFAGTSRTVSPSWTSRWAICRPTPLQPSNAHARSLNRRPATSISAYPT